MRTYSRPGAAAYDNSAYARPQGHSKRPHGCALAPQFNRGEDIGRKRRSQDLSQNWSSLSEANIRNHLNTALYIWPWKGPHIANYGVSAIAIRAMNGWQNSFRNNCSLSITGRPPRGTRRRRENSHR